MSKSVAVVSQAVFCLIDDAKVRTKRSPAKKIVAGWEFAGICVGVTPLKAV